MAFAPKRVVAAGEWTEIELEARTVQRDPTRQAIELSAGMSEHKAWGKVFSQLDTTLLCQKDVRHQILPIRIERFCI